LRPASLRLCVGRMAKDRRENVSEDAHDSETPLLVDSSQRRVVGKVRDVPLCDTPQARTSIGFALPGAGFDVTLDVGVEG
jgi:hypothetical protein